VALDKVGNFSPGYQTLTLVGTSSTLEFLCNFALFQVFAAKWVRTELLWVMAQRVVVISYRRFGINLSAPSSKVNILTFKEIAVEFRVCKSVNHDTFQLNQPTRCSNFSSLLLVV
jgi:hypothetical protein